MELYTRHLEVPILDHWPSTMGANFYNHVVYSLKRLGPQIRLHIPKLKHLDLILQKDAWVVVDRVLNDVPVMCWTNFETAHRQNIHEPIACEIRTWHAAAGLIRTRTLEAMELMLGEELAELEPEEDGARILPFPGKK